MVQGRSTLDTTKLLLLFTQNATLLNLASMTFVPVSSDSLSDSVSGFDLSLYLRLKQVERFRGPGVLQGLRVTWGFQ